MHAPSQNAFCQLPIDRAGLQREDHDAQQKALYSPQSNHLILQNGKIDIANQNYFLAKELIPKLFDPNFMPKRHVFLGLDSAQAAYFAWDIDSSPQPWDFGASQPNWQDLRSMMLGNLDANIASLLAYAKALLYWQKHSAFCPVCGSKTLHTRGGHAAECQNTTCKHTQFPRTDSAVIMRVCTAEKILLGRQASWPKNYYSTLAGFVEPVETPEAAVIREVMEESGVHVARVSYQCSQPWPFPCSLMLGFAAEVDESETEKPVDLSSGELEAARWWTRAEIRSALAEKTLFLPPRSALSNRLIYEWINHIV